MYMAPYLIIAGIICLFALVVTFKIGFSPDDADYDDQAATVKHWSYVTLIYVLAFVPVLLITLMIFYWLL